MTQPAVYVSAYVVLVMVLVLALVATGKHVPLGPLGLDPEIFKVVAGIVGTGLLGLFATVAVGELSAAKERREAVRAMRRKTLADVVDVYNSVKGIRRTLRAEAIRPAYADPAAHVIVSRYLDLLPRLLTPAEN